MELKIKTTSSLQNVLEEIRQITNKPSIAECIRDGIELYDLIIYMVSKGNHIYVGKDRDCVAEIILPHIEYARNKK